MKITEPNATLEAAGIEAGDTINEIYFAPDGVRIGVTTGRGASAWANKLLGVKVPLEKLLLLVEDAYAEKLAREAEEKAAAAEEDSQGGTQ